MERKGARTKVSALGHAEVPRKQLALSEPLRGKPLAGQTQSHTEVSTQLSVYTQTSKKHNLPEDSLRRE